MINNSDLDELFSDKLTGIVFDVVSLGTLSDERDGPRGFVAELCDQEDIDSLRSLSLGLPHPRLMECAWDILRMCVRYRDALIAVAETSSYTRQGGAAVSDLLDYETGLDEAIGLAVTALAHFESA